MITDGPDRLPVTALQRAMILDSIRAPDLGLNVEQFVFDLHGPLDLHSFERAWTEIFGRYGALRACFRADAEGSVHVECCPDVELPIQRLDWSPGQRSHAHRAVRGVPGERSSERIRRRCRAARTPHDHPLGQRAGADRLDVSPRPDRRSVHSTGCSRGHRRRRGRPARTVRNSRRSVGRNERRGSGGSPAARVPRLGEHARE